MNSLLSRTGSFLIGLGLLIAISGSSLAQDKSTPQVTATILPVHSIVARIMDGIGTPKLLIKNHTSSHHATLKPSQLKTLTQSDLVFWLGPAQEVFLQKSIGLVGEKTDVVTLLERPDLKLIRNRNGIIDPHIWLSTDYAILIARSAADKVAELLPENKSAIATNLHQFEVEMETLGRELQDLLSDAGSNNFLIYHDTLQYFSKQFDLNIHAIAVANEELAPGTKQIFSIRNLASTGKYRCMLIDSDANSAALKVAAKDAGLKIIIADPVGSTIAPGAGLYPKLMRAIAAKIAAC